MWVIRRRKEDNNNQYLVGIDQRMIKKEGIETNKNR